MYTPGDLLKLEAANSTFSYAEVLEVIGDELEVNFLEEQMGLIWRFNDDPRRVSKSSVRDHIKVDPITRRTVKAAWKQFGFVCDVDNFARTEDFNSGRVYLDLEKMDDDEEEDEKDDGYDYTDGFVVPDSVADEPFTFADGSAPVQLSEGVQNYLTQQGKTSEQYVQEMHDAVRRYNHWQPTDRSGIGIKRYVDGLSTRASNQANNERWSKRMREIDCKNPPIK